jgi:catechol 2,3-dioxygenase-like lactoylglutathione lyase family enzyme
MKVSGVRFLVNDASGWFDLLADLGGMTVSWGERGDGYVHFADPVTLSTFTAAEQASASASDRLLLTVETEDLAAAIKKAREAGYTVTDPEDRPDWGIRVAYLRGPDGVLVELHSHMPKEEWTADLQSEATKFDS